MSADQPAEPRPGPRRVVSVDLDHPLPDLTADDRYATAMVVGYRGAVPVGAIDVSLTQDPADAARALAPLLALPVPTDPADAVPDGELPSISVVVSTIVSRVDDLAGLLDSFEALDYPGQVEFLVVDNRVALPEEDPLPAIVARRARVRVVRESRAGASAGRNAGIESATGEVIAFTDDDVRVDRTWLRVIGQRFAQPDGIDAMTGLILPAELETPAQIWFEGYYGGFAGERHFAPVIIEAVPGLPHAVRGAKVSVRGADGHEQKTSAVYGIGAYGAGANMAFRRSSLQRVRGFDPALGPGTPALGGEDLATLVRILWRGGRLAFEPRAVVHHRHRRSISELHGQLHGYGLGFTAMLTSLVVDDPRHLLSLGWQVPPALGRFARKAADRVLRRSGRIVAERAHLLGEENLSIGYPRSLVTTELKGFPQGPVAFLRSRRHRLRIDRAFDPARNTTGDATR